MSDNPATGSRVRRFVVVREALRKVWDSSEFDAVGDADGLTMMADAVLDALERDDDDA